MMLETGSRILIVHRRLFETDKGRYFMGEVDQYESGLVKVTGHSWVQEQFGGKLVKKDELRTKIFSLMSGTLLVYELPSRLDLKMVKFVQATDGKLCFTDGSKFRMDLTESGYWKGDRKKV
jgi:predicted secreted hydrolase